MELEQKITQKEIEAVIKLEPFERYKYFMKRIAAWEKIYALQNTAGNEFAIEEVGEHIVIFFWSAKEFAELCISDVWSSYSVKEISLDNFQKEIIPLVQESNYLLGVFPANNKVGFIVELDEFMRDLNEELQQYE